MRIAVTGGICSGKSTILQCFQNAGVSISSADEFAREVFAEGETQARLAELLGTEPPVSGDHVRKALAESSHLRRQINQIMHPPIRRRMHEAGCTVHEVPLLIETCTQSRYDFVFLALCHEAERLKRISARYGEGVAAPAILDTQLSDQAKLPFADEIIRTDCGLDNVQQVIDNWVSEFVAF